jgi:hypothetical protein
MIDVCNFFFVLPLLTFHLLANYRSARQETLTHPIDCNPGHPVQVWFQLPRRYSVQIVQLLALEAGVASGDLVVVDEAGRKGGLDALKTEYVIFFAILLNPGLTQLFQLTDLDVLIP